MYNYSKIKSIYIKNFRNLGEVTLDFSESPIISLVGENESGKTSCVKSFGVCALHAWAREQKDFIRDGTNGFGVAILLEDGSLITRMKTNSTNKYIVKSANGEVWETNKLDSTVPVQVQELMGLVEEPETKEFLQIRTYEDQLLFVVTPASSNYKVMYNALKVDQLTRAIKIGSTEANSIKKTIDNNEVSIKTLTDNIKSIRLLDIEPLINIKNRLTSQLNALDKLEKAKSLLDRIGVATRQLGALQMLSKYNVQPVNIVEVNNLESINRVFLNRNRLIKLLQIDNYSSTLESIDLSTLNKTIDIIYKKIELRNKMVSAHNLLELTNLSEISEFETNQLNRAMALKHKINSDLADYNVIKTDGCKPVQQADFDAVNKACIAIELKNRNALLGAAYKESIDYVNQVSNYLKQCGAAVVSCPKCGESIVIDTESL